MPLGFSLGFVCDKQYLKMTELTLLQQTVFVSQIIVVLLGS